MYTRFDDAFAQTYHAWRAVEKLNEAIQKDMDLREQLAREEIVAELGVAAAALNTALARWPLEESK